MKLSIVFRTVAPAMMALAAMVLWLHPGSVQAQSGWTAPPDANSYINPAKADAKSIEAGKKVYDTYCVLCHGPQGDGKGASSRTLTVVPADLTDQALMKQSDGSLAWKILTGKGPMPSWAPVLAEDQIWNVINFIRQFPK